MGKGSGVRNTDLSPGLRVYNCPERKWEGREKDDFGWTKIKSEANFEMSVSHPSGNVK